MEFSALQEAALGFFVAASEYTKQYESLASGWPADRTVQHARSVFTTYSKHWADFGVAGESRKMIERQLPEAPLTLFKPCLTPTVNTLTSVYWQWLATPDGGSLAKKLIGTAPRWTMAGRQAGGKDKDSGPELSSTNDYLAGW